MLSRVRIQAAPRALLLVLLCVLAYAPMLSIPLMEDDWPNLAQSLKSGSWDGLPILLGDAVFRLRATSYWVMYDLWSTFHAAPVAYHVVSLLLHICGTLLLYIALREMPPVRGAAFYAAGFFAVAEGHQEAVMWFSAINELLMFTFGMAAIVAWLAAESRPGRGWALRTLSLTCFALALLSKESAVILLPLMLLARPAAKWRQAVWRLSPYAMLAALAIVSLLVARSYSFRFTDGSFSLSGPLWIILPKNVARLLWIWGWMAMPLVLRGKATRVAAVGSLAWIVLALLPYSFLTYSTQIPSRQTYLASAGLALLFGLAATQIASRRLMAAVLVVALLHNAGYLWIRKRAQFLQRAEPTEQLIRLARQTDGPIRVQCFPRVRLIADEAVHLGAGRPASTLLWSEAEAREHPPAATFCYGK